MGMHLGQIPEKIRDHVRSVAKQTTFPDPEEAIEAVAKSWLEKQHAFENRIRDLGMRETEYLDRSDSRGALIMTYSGSLLNIGPLGENGRTVEYASIGLRKDVPETARKMNSLLKSDLELDEEIRFTVGPIRTSSLVFKIAVFSEELAPEQQEERLSSATQTLTADFITTNTTHLGA